MSDRFLITREQLRAGRVLAGLGIRDLAVASGVSATAVSHIETGRTAQAHAATLHTLRATLERHGVEFAEPGWVRRVVRGARRGRARRARRRAVVE